MGVPWTCHKLLLTMIYSVNLIVSLKPKVRHNLHSIHSFIDSVSPWLTSEVAELGKVRKSNYTTSQNHDSLPRHYSTKHVKRKISENRRSLLAKVKNISYESILKSNNILDFQSNNNQEETIYIKPNEVEETAADPVNDSPFKKSQFHITNLRDGGDDIMNDQQKNYSKNCDEIIQVSSKLNISDSFILDWRKAKFRIVSCFEW